MNFLMSLVVLPRLDFSFLAEEIWGETTIGAVCRRLVGRRSPRSGDPDHCHHQLPSSPGIARNHGRRRQCFGLADSDGRQSRGIRRGW